jgi:hypothetical protein
MHVSQVDCCPGIRVNIFLQTRQLFILGTPGYQFMPFSIHRYCFDLPLIVSEWNEMQLIRSIRSWCIPARRLMLLYNDMRGKAYD